MKYLDGTTVNINNKNIVSKILHLSTKMIWGRFMMHSLMERGTESFSSWLRRDSSWTWSGVRPP